MEQTRPAPMRFDAWLSHYMWMTRTEWVNERPEEKARIEKMYDAYLDRN